MSKYNEEAREIITDEIIHNLNSFEKTKSLKRKTFKEAFVITIILAGLAVIMIAMAYLVYY